MEQIKFNIVGYGCTTCIGNSGPLPAEVSHAIDEKNLVVASVLSGNRNFEGRINSEVRANYLMSPPLVVAFALAGSVDANLMDEPVGIGKDGEKVYLRDIWPTQQEVQDTIAACIDANIVPEPDDPGGRIYYCVLMPPGTSYGPGGALGAHSHPTDYDFPFDREAVAVPPGHVVRIVAEHLLAARDDILQNLVEGVPDMDIAIGVRRPVMQDEFVSVLGGRAQLPVKVALFPARQNFRLTLW